MPETRTIPLDLIVEPPEPVRVSMDEAKLYELRDSIRSLGLLQPIGVFPVDDKYEIIFGHRRFLASRLVPLKEIECKVYPTEYEGKLAAMIAENGMREDVTAAEEGWKYLDAVEKFKPTEAQLCAMFQQSPEYIYARMDMCQKDSTIAQLVAERKINFSVAKELLKCGDAEHRAYLAQLCAESGATARVARMYVQQHVAQQQGTIEPPPATNVPDAGSPPVENTVKCFCCGGEKDPQNLRLIYVHWYELDTWKRILTEAGLRPADSPAAAGAA